MSSRGGVRVRGGEGAWGARDQDVVLCGVFLYSRAVVSDR